MYKVVDAYYDSDLYNIRFIEECDSRQEGWDKATIEYVRENRGVVMSVIRGVVLRGGFSKVVKGYDYNDIYDELVLYLYKYDDYDTERAIQSCLENGYDSIISLESYITVCIKNCVKRYAKSRRDYLDKIINGVINERDGKDLSLLDIIPDKRMAERYESIEFDLDLALKAVECKRYRYGVDIYQLLYISLMYNAPIVVNDDSMSIDTLLYKVLNIGKKEIYNVVSNLLRVLGIGSHDVVLRLLGRYVYGVDMLNSIIKRVEYQ